MIKRCSPNRRRQGFTLLELLMGMILFSFVGLTVYASFALGLKIDSQVRRIHAFCHESRQVFDLFSQDIENAISYDFTAQNSAMAAFKGSPDQCTFLIADPNEGVVVVNYALGTVDLGTKITTVIGQHYKKLKQVIANSHQDNARQFLIRRKIDMKDYLDAISIAEPEIIAAGVKKGSLRFYYGGNAKGQSLGGAAQDMLEWQDSWENPGLPAVVRVAMAFVDDNNPNGPGVLLTRDFILPVQMDKISKATLGVSNKIIAQHTLQIRHLKSIREFKQ